MKIAKYILLAYLFAPASFLEGIVFKEPSAREKKKSYRTVSQLKAFFKKHGMQYLEQNLYAYTPVLKQNMKKEAYYKDNKSVSDFLTKKYEDCVRSYHRAPIELRWVNSIVGYGVFAYKSIKQGDFIAEYTGEVDLKANIDDKDYCWAYSAETDDGKPLSCDSKYKGNEMRYVNHSYNQNVIMKYILVDNIWHICYLAVKDIAPGEQLLVSYGENYWKTRSIACQDL